MFKIPITYVTTVNRVDGSLIELAMSQSELVRSRLEQEMICRSLLNHALVLIFRYNIHANVGFIHSYLNIAESGAIISHFLINIVFFASKVTPFSNNL